MTTFACSVWACGIAACVGGSVSAQGPILIDDFSSPNEAAWTHFDPGIGGALAPYQYDRTGGVYRLHSATSLSTLYGEFMISLMLAPQRPDGAIRVRMRCNSTNGSGVLAIRCTSAANDARAYHLDLATSQHEAQSIVLKRTNVGDEDSVIASVPRSTLNITTGTEYIVVLSAVGSTITAKVWPRIGAAEPPLPQISVTDSTWPTGGVGVAAIVDASPPTPTVIDTIFDDLWFFPIGAHICGRADVASLGGAPIPDGQLTVDDLIAFLSAFFSGNDIIADVASLGGGPVPDGQLTVDDIISFLAAYFAGCV